MEECEFEQHKQIFFDLCHTQIVVQESALKIINISRRNHANNVNTGSQTKERRKMKTSTESVVTITSLLRSVFAPPPKPTPYSFETANFYANLTEPDLGEIRTAIQNERRKFKKSIQQGNWSTWYTIAFEVLRIVHNTTRRFLQRPFIASMMFMIILSLVSAISSVLIDLMTVKLIQGTFEVTVCLYRYSNTFDRSENENELSGT